MSNDTSDNKNVSRQIRQKNQCSNVRNSIGFFVIITSLLSKGFCPKAKYTSLHSARKGFEPLSFLQRSNRTIQLSRTGRGRLTPIRTGNTLLEGAGYIPLTMSPPYYKAPCRIERLLQAVCLTCSLHQDAGPPCLGIISGNHFVGANNMVPV
jgi:hypothetical protein